MADADQKRERLHSTVRLNHFTLQFEDPALEKVYQAELYPRKKALWLRSLLPAAASQLLFALADGLDFSIENLLISIPTRIFIAMFQVAMYILVRWDLVRAQEQTIVLVSGISGIVTLLLYTLQRSSLCHWDALFVTFGLSFYTIPKITPLGYVSSFYGSWSTTFFYSILAFTIQSPLKRAPVILSMCFLVPMVWIFNTIAYSSEYHARERFALRRRLRRERITVAVACDDRVHQKEENGWVVFNLLSLHGLLAANRKGTTSFLLAVILWGMMTLGGWTSLPKGLKFVDEATGWAWFSHCAGGTVFLVLRTRRLRWVVIVPVLGAFVLYLLTLTIPASWIIISAHSVGYGLLLASIILTMGVFGWFLCAWRQLVSFLTRSCFLFPQLQAGMEQEYPLLVRIVSEYTAGFDPEILAARVPITTVSKTLGTQCTDRIEDGNVKMLATFQDTNSMVQKKDEMKLSSNDCTIKSSHSMITKHKESTFATRSTIMSVLPSFTPGKCFFCSQNEAEHLVPACGMWGKWTHWRMNQHFPSSLDSKTSKISSNVAMCTSYYDLQKTKQELEVQIEDEEKKVKSLLKQNQDLKEQVKKGEMEKLQLMTKVYAMEEKHSHEIQQKEMQWNRKLALMQQEFNQTLQHHKLEIETTTKTFSNALKTNELQVETLVTRLQSAETDVQSLRLKLETSEKNVFKWKTQATASLDKKLHSTHVLCSPSKLQTFPSSRRLPYAQSLEIEGLRESSRKSKDEVDYSKQWQRFQAETLE
ncbi:uncharacterized protein PHALS_10061 [Plasmopara halstedii]|uniref:Uncharacterized protein n=1 Tax=Plasmopara halstedii TaxID=4781 RepID=A0A0N7L4W7_PLAHL|nr:uncharacterized protein PHALS_10061 [Plasmopara halstedii]CEG39827.1 hypothetical protein PHALS_10061 [Plasmopara halstedii]|eukprot:XP_024576196.1 hypothetical protein PHALS_10061 [Plasmopara halstedii]